MQILKKGTCGICNMKTTIVLDVNDLNFFICEDCIKHQFEEDEYLDY